MTVWILTVGEPLPTDGENERLFRSGILAEQMANEGHDVVFFSSAFDHVRKQFRAKATTTIQVAGRTKKPFDLVLLKGCGYKRNIGLERMRDHRQIGQAFARLAPSLPRPDVILCSIPIVELASAALAYAKPLGIPVALDCRDMWPDILAQVGPSILHPLERLMMHPMFVETRNAFQGASAITGHTSQFVEWGLSYAARAQSQLDRDFPFGYVSTAVSDADLASAEAHWDSLGVGGDKFRMCFFGAVSHQFAWPVLAQGFRRLAALQPDGWEAIICGDGDQMSKVREWMQDIPQVRLAGWVDRARIQVLGSRSHIGLAPYNDHRMYRETIPNKVIEYLNFGLPIAWSLDDGVIADMITTSDIGFSWGLSPERFAVEIQNLMTNPTKVERQSRRSRDLFEQKFTAEQVYEGMAQWLAAVAKAPSRGA